MNYVIWDVETDSADTNYATIIEIGALLLDENFREKEKCEKMIQMKKMNLV